MLAQDGKGKAPAHTGPRGFGGGRLSVSISAGSQLVSSISQPVPAKQNKWADGQSGCLRLELTLTWDCLTESLLDKSKLAQVRQRRARKVDEGRGIASGLPPSNQPTFRAPPCIGSISHLFPPRQAVKSQRETALCAYGPVWPCGPVDFEGERVETRGAVGWGLKREKRSGLPMSILLNSGPRSLRCGIEAGD